MGNIARKIHNARKKTLLVGLFEKGNSFKKKHLHKMRPFEKEKNVISFANPIAKVYNVLPPARHELEEMLAFMYTGPCQPTKEDLERTPLLVRRNKVKAALDWLKVNHTAYNDINISIFFLL